MRNLKLMMFFMAVATMPFFTSCSNDKDDDKGNADVSGTYTGKITVMMTAETPNSVAVLKKTEEVYTLQLEKLNIVAPFPPGTEGSVVAIGDVSITNVKAADGKLSGGDEKSISVTLPPALADMNDGVAEVTVKVSLTNGTVSGNNLKFTLNVEVPMKINGVSTIMPVSVSFDGNK